MAGQPPQKRRTCFVTIGATASFSSLVQVVLSTQFIDALQLHGYSELLVQYGQNGKSLYDTCISALSLSPSPSLLISGFDLDKDGLQRYMRRAKGMEKGEQEGSVISHAGSGTILDALRISVPLIVVPNTELLDNHQVELAEALAEQEYVVYGRLDSLSTALDEVAALGQKQKSWPPPNSGVHRQTHGLKGVIEDEMGFLD